MHSWPLGSQNLDAPQTPSPNHYLNNFWIYLGPINKELYLQISMNRSDIAKNYLRITEERMYRRPDPGLAKVDPPPPPPGDKDFGILN